MNLFNAKMIERKIRTPKSVILVLSEKLEKNGPSPVLVWRSNSVAISASHPSPSPMIAPVTIPGIVTGSRKYRI